MSNIELEHPRVIQTLSLNHESARSRASPRPSRPIHVDEDNDDEVFLVETPPRRRRRLNNNGDDEHSTNYRTVQDSPEAGIASRPILILDSDEEDSSGATSYSSGARNRGATSQNRNVQVPPPIIAGELPFAVLPPAPNGDPSRNRPPFDEPPQPAAGPSGGGPARQPLRLGGGLFSQANRRARNSGHVTRNADTDNYNPGSGAPQDPMSRLGRVLATYVTRNPRRLAGLAEILGPNTRIVDFATMAGGFFNLFAGGAPVNYGLSRDYEKSMTHPGRPGPGWTYDFGPQEGEEKKESEEILVCAHCLEPLLANADNVTDMNEKEKKKRRVWGMRCGHVLDGTCVEAVMIPEEERHHDEDEMILDTKDDAGKLDFSTSKGRGKAKQTASVPSTGSVHEHDNEPSDHLEGLVEVIPDPFIAPAEEPIVAFDEPLHDPDNSIRSRLRRRGPATTTKIPSSSTQPSLLPSPIRRSTRSINAPSPSTHSPLSPPPLPTATRPRAPAPRRTAATKRKRRGKKGANNGEEVIENRYHWPCPVPSCGKVHESIKVSGVWKTDPENGPIVAYV